MYALLVKPAALRSKRHRKVVNQLIADGAVLLRGKNIVDLRIEVEQLCAENSKVTVVACGGDGTAHLLINSVVGLPISFAVVPMGTGNDFARYLGIRDTKTGYAALSSDKVRRLDIGIISFDDGLVRHFLGIASCGFDAQVNERANGYRGPQGTAKYILALLAELRSLSPLSLNVVTSRVTHSKELTLLAVGNTCSYGGGMKVCPTADASDGLFSVTIVSKVTRRLLLRVFPRVFTGSHVQHPAVQTFDTENIRISGNPFAIYADGERVGIGPATFTISPQALQTRVI